MATMTLPAAEAPGLLERAIRRIRDEAGGGDDDPAEIPIPAAEFEAAPDLEAIAEALIEEDDVPFAPLMGCRIAWFWRAKAGKTGGRTVFGKAQLASGLLAHVTGADLVVWFGADACRAAAVTNRQLEAGVFHELCKVERVVGKQGNVRWQLRPPDFAGFLPELARYGAWRKGLREAGRSFRAMPLPLFDEAA